MSFTEDFSKLSRQQLIDRVIDLELIVFHKAEELDGLPFHVPNIERLILATLYRARGRKCSWEFIQQSCGSSSWKSVKVNICKLRKRLQSQEVPMSVESFNGEGYWLGPKTLEQLDTILHVGPSEIPSDYLSSHRRACIVRKHPARATESTPGANAPQP